MRTLREIAKEIKQDWVKPYFGAVPYIQALNQLENIEDSYGYDDARTMVIYFLANAQTWKGEKAREIKKELNKLIK